MVGTKCQSCGTWNDHATGPCPVCGYIVMAGLVRLVGSRTGGSRDFRLSTRIGRRLLNLIAGEEAIYASEPQFEIIKDTVAGCWLIRHLSVAVHPTYYDGRPVGDELVPLQTGGVITIGPHRMKLDVALSS